MEAHSLRKAENVCIGRETKRGDAMPAKWSPEECENIELHIGMCVSKYFCESV